VNSQSREETVTLSSTGPLPSGYVQRWYSVPTGDGIPSDGVPLTSALRVPADGGAVALVGALAVPEAGAGAGASTGTLAAGQTASTTARTDVILPALLTSTDPHDVFGAVRFSPCATVYARVSGLLPASVSAARSGGGIRPGPAWTPRHSPRTGTAWRGRPSRHRAVRRQGLGSWC